MAKRNKDFFQTEEKEETRLNKFLSEQGICSRRQADELIEKGEVLVDGIPAVTGMKVSSRNTITVSGKKVETDRRLVLIAMNKPKGIICTTDVSEPDNVIDFLNYGKRIFPIGRLDKDSEGLLLLTNDGDIVNKILRSGNRHEKEYRVKVNQDITSEFIKGMAAGVPILDTVTKPCFIEAVGKREFRIILTQGLNRQIRRMCEHFGFQVMSLQRVRIMNITLGHLKTGDFRNVTDWELAELRDLLEDSENEPVIDFKEENGKQDSGKRSNEKKGYSKPGDLIQNVIKKSGKTSGLHDMKTNTQVNRKNGDDRITGTRKVVEEYGSRTKQDNNRRADSRTNRVSQRSGKGVRTGRPRTNK